jgi:geranylgeranyl diphosphate synthase type I
MLRTAIRESGAVDQVERIIDHNVGLARAAMDAAPLSRSSREQLLQLAETVTRRVS